MYDGYLDSGRPFPDSERYGTLETFTAKFDDGHEADVKVCVADDNSLFIDAVLFNKDGGEVATCEPAFEVEGECYFYEKDGTEYVVEIKAA